MTKLLRSELLRLLKSRTFYIFLLLSVFLGFFVIFIETDSDRILFNTGFSGNIGEAYINNYTRGVDHPVSYDIREFGNNIVIAAFFITILSSIFNVTFIGKLFTNGTVRNMISIGHKKSSVFLSCLIINIITTVIFYLLFFASFTVYILAAGLHPVIWWKYILMFTGIMFLESMVVISIVTMILFSTRKLFLSLISPIILIVIFNAGSMVSMGGNDTVLADYIAGEYTSLEEFRTSEMISSFNDKEYRMLLINADTMEEMEHVDHSCDLTSGDKVKINIQKCIPFTMMLDYSVFTLNPYYFFISGIGTRYLIVGIVWLLLSSTAGIVIFSKRDIM